VNVKAHMAWNRVLLTVALVVLVAACGQPGTTLSDPGAPPAAIPPSMSVIRMGAPAPQISPTAMTQAQGQARAMVEIAVVPPGARAVTTLPSQLLSSPEMEPGCDPVVLATRRWIVPGSPSQLETFLTQHVPPSLIPSSYSDPYTMPPPIPGQPPRPKPKIIPVFSLSDQTHGNVGNNQNEGNNQLEFTWASVGGNTGLRADGMIVPAGAGCVTAGGASAF
jgi:hypothetical protein